MPRLDEIKDKLLSIHRENFPGGKLLLCIAVLGKSSWIGNNNYKTHPMMLRKFSNGQEKSCSHAEVSALAKVPRQSRDKVELFVIRFLRDGSLSMAKPCKMCRAFLAENGVDFRNVYYTDWSGDGKWNRLG